MSGRERLPDRRVSLSFEFDCDGLPCRAQFSLFSDGRAGELFLNVGKTGSAAAIAAHDGAVCASLALQHGVNPEVVSHALLKLPSGASAGPIGKAFDLLDTAA